MTFQLDIGFASSAGNRTLNEDFAAALLPEANRSAMGAVCAVADGVSRGGHGKEAAQTTVTSLVRDYFCVPETWHTTVALDRILSAQNRWLAGINRRRMPALGLCALTALVLRGHSYSIAHVGDTRACLYRDDQWSQLTVDHVVHHPDFQHQLVRAIGMDEHLIVDYLQGEVRVGDVFVLLTDGVHGVLREQTLKQIVRGTHADAQALSESLIQRALDAGSKDNVTALVVRVVGLSAPTLEDQSHRMSAAPVPPLLKVGDVLDGLCVTAKVADNGINVLYQVRDPNTQALYALKTLHPARSKDQEERAMLAHEAWLADRVSASAMGHHLVARVPWPPSRSDDPSGLYVVYEWHRGQTLGQMVKTKQPFAVDMLLQTGLQAARALSVLHRQGIIHRDIKPDNLHWGDDRVLRILDLGVALSGREPSAQRLLHAGTPTYMNPEQWGHGVHASQEGGAPATHKSDLYALGVTLYELATGGKLPYGEVLPYQKGRFFRDPKPPSHFNPALPKWLDHLILKAVHLNEAVRFETADELILSLERGAARTEGPLPATPLAQRDPYLALKVALVFSVLLNVLLVYWLVFLPAR